MNKEPRKLPYIKINRPVELAKRIGVPLDVLEKVAADPKKHFHSWSAETRGKRRTFHQAEHDLEAIHDKLNKEILDRFDFPLEFQGAIKGRSLRSNALRHVGKKNIAGFDIKNYFPSVKPKKVYNTFVQLGCQPDVARLITRLVTADGCLPQGYKTSPKVAALVLLPVQRRIAGLTKGLKVSQSFWVDDLALSGSYPLRKLKPSIKKIFKQSGFTAHKDENFPVYRDKRQVVTGVVVNDKPSVKKEIRKEVEKIVFLAEKNGLRQYKRQYSPDLGLVKLGQKVSGRISNMVSIDAEKYKDLQERWGAVLEKAGIVPAKEETKSKSTAN